MQICSSCFRERGSYTAREAWDQRRKEASLAERWGEGARNTTFNLAHRFSIAHPDLCWVCFDLNMRCHHTHTRWSELVRREKSSI